MKAKELKQKSDSELKKLYADTQKKLFEGRFNLESGKVKNVSSFKEYKRDIARILTLLREREEDNKHKS